MYINKKLIYKLITVITLTASVILFANWNDKAESVGVVGSKHDFSILGGSNFQFETVQACIFCHTPHGANINTKNKDTVGADLNGLLLWNRNSPGQSFNVYRSSTLDYAGTITSPQPGPRSLLCMSCHDGIGAINVLLNGGELAAWGGTDQNQIGDFTGPLASLNIGGATNTGANLATDWGDGGDNLTDDHPVGFVFDSALATSDGNLHTPISSQFVDAGKVIRLFEGRLECSSCHNPHDNSNTKFLVMSNDSSALCLTCHDK